jgi:cell wall-associated NlpC family hydrolase
MLKMTIVLLAGPVLGGGGLVAAGAGLVAGIPGMTATTSSYPAAVAQVPADMLALYQRAAPVCPGLPWSLLAAVGAVESNNGQDVGPSPAGAVGPMQFEPATFAAYAEPVPPGGLAPPTPYDAVDAVFAAARYLCALGVVDDPRLALVAYNCGHPGPVCQRASGGYASEVLDRAAQLAAQVSDGPSATAAAAEAWAESQIGVPYRWGGEAPGQAFDCSGLVQWAYAQAGVSLPRTAQSQYDTGPVVAPGSPLEPGDLIFFGSGPAGVEHVGLYVGAGLMIDAPHTGADVRVEPVFMPFVGVTRPGN